MQPTESFIALSTDPLVGSKRRFKNGPDEDHQKREKTFRVADPLEITRTNAAPWARGKQYSKNATRRLHEEILDFVDFVSPTKAEHAARTQIVSRLRAAITSKYPDATITVFGSYDTKLYLPSADIDVVVRGIFSSNRTTVPLKKVAALLVQKEIAESSSVRIIDKARIPIIKFKDSLLGFDVDVSFNVDSGTESAEILKALLDLIPSIKPLTLVVKQFLCMRQLNEVFSGGLGSYGVVLLIVSFLQMHPLIQAKAIRAEENYGVLLVEFFELYGRLFNYELVGISLRNGGNYFDRARKATLNCINGERGMLCLEDPQNDQNNVAKGSYAMHAVQRAFEHAYNILTCVLGEVERRRKRGDSWDSENSSILSSILFMDPLVLERRSFIQQQK